ncbi:transglutaminase TgpA family protein [Frateuria defendens]|uniref:transglutaminase TgpA family protein n=1 Tax=Frateuria defendens TaxID=2219559 RepID=UPI00066FF68E|nr:DUF3488 and transglutaminase-like domain-containing protein [Frateuria defendens]
MIRRRRTPPGPPTAAHTLDLLSLAVALVLAVHASHLPVWLTPPLGLLLGLRWWQRRRRPGGAPLWLKLLLTAGLLAAVIAGYGNLFGREPGSALAVGLLVLKLLECETSRDVRVGVGFACFTLMAALLFDQGMVATFVVALGLLPALAALRSLEPAQAPAKLPRELLQALKLLAASLPLALVAFLLVPRLSSPLWGTPNPGAARTGLSDSMEPGSFTELLTDDRPAFRVSFDGPPPPPAQRYFRAYVMWHYDGRRWNHVDLRRPPVPIDVDRSIGYQVSLEPGGAGVLPALDVPLDTPAQARGRMGEDRELLRNRPVEDLLVYTVHSALSYRLQPDLPAPARQRDLALPPGFNPRARALAAQWRQRYGQDDAAVARAALALFHDGGFSYTLAPAPLGRDAVDDFLFGTREGFCEHYASAFTVLMRAAGIPARVVTGYQGGYWNGMSNYLLVRQSDAHAWSEIWLSGRGWVRMDPTAAVRPERVNLGANAAAGAQAGWAHAGWLEELRNRWDVVNRWWNQGVIGFDVLRQRGLLTPFGISRVEPSTLVALLGVGMVLSALAGLAWALRRHEARDPALAALRKLERRLARRGLARRPGEGPQHFLSRAARALPAQRKELESLMSCYLELRYAHDEPPTELLRVFHRAVRDFRPRGVVK